MAKQQQGQSLMEATKQSKEARGEKTATTQLKYCAPQHLGQPEEIEQYSVVEEVDQPAWAMGKYRENEASKKRCTIFSRKWEAR